MKHAQNDSGTAKPCRKRYQTAWRLTCWLLALTLLSACGRAQPAETEATPAATTAPILTPPEPAVNLLFGVPFHENRRINPITASSQTDRDVDALLFDPLFRVDASYQAQPNLCTEAVYEDGKLRLTIREGVLFTDGSMLGAEDVVYSLRMAMEDEHSCYRSRFAGVTAIEAAGNRSVVLTLHAAHPSLTAMLDIPIIKHGTGQDNDAVGTGRYRMMESDGQRYLVTNTAHFSGQSGHAQMTYMLLVDVSDADALIYAAVSGNLGILRPTIAAGVELHADADRCRMPTTTLIYIGFRMASGLFASETVRRSAAAVLADADWTETQTAQAPDFYPAALGYADSDDADADETTRWAIHGTVRLLVNADEPDELAAAEATETALTAAGLTVTCLKETGSAYTAALQKGAYDLFVGAFDAGADFDLRGLLATGGSQNRTGCGSAELDALLTSYVRAGTADGELIARQIVTAAKQEAAVVPVGYRCDAVLLNRKFGIRNVKPTADDVFDNIYDWVYDRAETK